MIAVDYNYHRPILLDWIVSTGVELQCASFLVLVDFWLPISDWLMRRRMRKRAEYQFKLRQLHQRKYETTGKSPWHGRTKHLNAISLGDGPSQTSPPVS